MKYVISNLSVLPNKRAKVLFTEQVERLVYKLKILPNHYIESEKLKINISKINNFEYRISCSLKMKNSLVFLSESGKDLQSISQLLFDKFRKKVANQLAKNRLWYVKNKKRQSNKGFENYIDDLSEFKMSEDETSFKSLVRILLPGLERYIERMLASAQMANLLTSGDVTSEDITDEVILRTFKTFEDNKDKAEDMNIWMMQETDVVLNELLDHVKQRTHAASYEELVDSEYASLEKEARYVFDSSGDPILMDELDEPDETNLPDSLIGIEEAYLMAGSEKEVIDKISDKLSRKQMNELVRNELINLPLRHQSVYDLFFLEQLDIEDIAKIKSETPERIEAIIDEVKTYLTKRLRI
jgi:DNA-directed RNA polymerase specialized sigma24 family protein